MTAKITKLSRVNIFIGVVFVLYSIIPVWKIFFHFTKGQYGPLFKGISPVYYHLSSFAFSYLILSIIVFFLIKKMHVYERLHIEYTSNILFAIGNIITIHFVLLRIFSSVLPGGGAPFVVSILGVYPITIARICLYIAFARVLIGMEPAANKVASNNA